MRQLNVGCGRDIREGFDNLDRQKLPGVDIVANVEDPAWTKKREDTYDLIMMLHLIEHLKDPLRAMENLWRVAKPGGRLAIITPHGGSDTAWADPTHLRPMFPSSFGYFGQHHYHFADYGYRGDWEVVEIIVEVREQFKHKKNLAHLIEHQRNTCRNLRVIMEAVKPARPVTTIQPQLTQGVMYVP